MHNSIFPGWVLEWVQRLHASDIQLQAASDSPIPLPPHPFLAGMNQLENLGTVILQSYSFIINLLKTKFTQLIATNPAVQALYVEPPWEFDVVSKCFTLSSDGATASGFAAMTEQHSFNMFLEFLKEVSGISAFVKKKI